MLTFNDKPIKLELTKEQFLVIYEFLYHTQLGDDNQFTGAISDLMIDLEENGSEDLINDIKDEVGEVRVCAHFSQEDGMSFILEESY